MKKLIVISFAVLLAIASMPSQARIAGSVTSVETHLAGKDSKKYGKVIEKLNKSKVSFLSREQFLEDFNNVSNVVWKRPADFDEATFDKNGHKETAYYDFNSKLVGITTIKKFDDLPSYSQNEIKKEYKDYIIGPVIFFDDNEQNDMDMILYGSSFEDADNYFAELIKGNDRIVIKITPEGNLSFFKKL